MIASVLWTTLSITTGVGMALALLALLVSNALGDRVQTILLCVVLLVLGLTWLVSSITWLSSDPFGWWWAGVVISGGVAGVASFSLWRTMREH